LNPARRYAPGGSTDIVARLIGQWLSERLGQQFVIDNRPGASGNIGTELVVRAPPDGYTLLLALSSDAISATLYKDLQFNFIRDITPVAGIVRVPNVMEVNPSFPAKTVPEFIAYPRSAVLRLRCRSRRTRSSRSGCGASACCLVSIRTIPKQKSIQGRCFGRRWPNVKLF
jgi:tripartite-type tricarboxylate transporter receptor subunit TctC